MVGYSGTPLPKKLGIRGDTRFDVILLFVSDERALTEGLDAAPDHLEVAGGLRVGWPRMKSSLFDGLKESHVRDAGLRTGMVDHEICAIDEDWSGLRFVFRKENRPGITARRNADEGGG